MPPYWTLCGHGCRTGFLWTGKQTASESLVASLASGLGGWESGVSAWIAFGSSCSSGVAIFRTSLSWGACRRYWDSWQHFAICEADLDQPYTTPLDRYHKVVAIFGCKRPPWMFWASITVPVLSTFSAGCYLELWPFNGEWIQGFRGLSLRIWNS